MLIPGIYQNPFKCFICWILDTVTEYFISHMSCPSTLLSSPSSLVLLYLLHLRLPLPFSSPFHPPPSPLLLSSLFNRSEYAKSGHIRHAAAHRTPSLPRWQRQPLRQRKRSPCQGNTFICSPTISSSCSSLSSSLLLILLLLLLSLLPLLPLSPSLFLVPLLLLSLSLLLLPLLFLFPPYRPSRTYGT